ncbi:MAG: hypothetical protein AAGI03_01460 [Pseudomonadota bacterium]
MAIAAAANPHPDHGASPFYGHFDPDDFDDLAQTLADAERVVDQHQALKAKPKKSRLARNPNVAGAMAAFMVARHRNGHDTMRDHLRMVGWTSQDLERHYNTAFAMAMLDIRAADEGLLDEEAQREAQALAECAACAHAGGDD